jgi:hypothetical protein
MFPKLSNSDAVETMSQEKNQQGNVEEFQTIREESISKSVWKSIVRFLTFGLTQRSSK